MAVALNGNDISNQPKYIYSYQKNSGDTMKVCL